MLIQVYRTLLGRRVTPRRLAMSSVAVMAALVLSAGAFGPAFPPAARAAAPRPPANAEALVDPVPAPAPGFDGPVWTVAYAGTTAYIGGEFGHAIVGRQRVPRAGLAAVDTRTGALLPWAPAADGLVTALATYGGDVFVAGKFRHISGVPRDSLARLHGRTGSVRPGFDHLIWGTPYALDVGHGRLYLGGNVSRVGDHQRQGLAAFGLTTGAVDPVWAPTADARVNDLVVTTDRIYLAGRFRRVNDIGGILRVTAVHPVTGALNPGFYAEDAIEGAYDLALGPEGVYVAHGGLGGRVRAYDHTGRTRWELTMDGDPTTVTRLGDTVYFGGHFDTVCRSARVGDQGTCVDGSLPRMKLGAVSVHDGTLSPWRADGNGVVGVRVVKAAPDRAELAVGGEFTTINGAPHRRFARFRLPADSSVAGIVALPRNFPSLDSSAPGN